MLRIVLTSLLASTALVGAAFAQNEAIRPDTRRDYQVQTPAPRPVEQRFQNRGDIVGINRGGPRFIVEAISFKAVNESGIDFPYTSDEIFAVFTTPTSAVETRNFEQVDTGDTERFPRHQSCIWPAIDPDGTKNGRWACDPAGREGPIQFRVRLLDDDWEGDILPGFSVSAPTDVYGGINVNTEANDTVFNGEFRYEVSDIIQRLNPACRCLTQTARESVDDETTYEFTFRITMVDGGGDLAILDEGANSAGTGTVHRSGALSARPNQGFDFDAGTLAAPASSDFVFSRSGGSFFLTGGNGAKIWVGGAGARGYATCFAQRTSANYVAGQVNVPAVGSHACYITSDGRVGELRIASLTPSPMATELVVSFTTWQ